MSAVNYGDVANPMGNMAQLPQGPNPVTSEQVCKAVALSALHRVVETGYSAAVCVVGAIALSNPITAAQAAIFGAVRYGISQTVDWVVSKVPGFRTTTERSPDGLIRTKKPSLIARVISGVAAFFASVAATWGISTALGYGLTFTAALALSAATGGIGIGIALGIALVVVVAAMAFGKMAELEAAVR